jgi:hypothetical protein
MGGNDMILRVAITGALAIAAAAASQSVHAQGQVEIGRYQIAIPINSDSTALLIDTVTGRSWALGSKSDRRWHDLNFGEVKNGHLMLTPQPCTEDNPTCYFSVPKGADESPAAQKPQ